MKNVFPRATWIPLLLAVLLLLGFFIFVSISPHEKTSQMMTLSNLKQTGVEILVYAEGNHGKMPPLRNRDDLLRAVPKIRPEWLETAKWKIPFATNPKLSSVDLGKVDEAPHELVLLYEAKPVWFAKSRGVLFADGHVKIVNNERWQEIRERNGLPVLAEPAVARWWEFGRIGPREPVAYGFLGLCSLTASITFLVVASVIRARLSPSPVVEFIGVFLFYGTLVFILGVSLVSLLGWLR